MRLTLCIDGRRAVYTVPFPNPRDPHLISTVCERKRHFPSRIQAWGQLDWAVNLIGLKTVENWCDSRFPNWAVIVQMKQLASFLHKPQTEILGVRRAFKQKSLPAYPFQNSKEEVVFISHQRPFKRAALITVSWGKLIGRKDPSFYSAWAWGGRKEVGGMF